MVISIAFLVFAVIGFYCTNQYKNRQNAIDKGEVVKMDEQIKFLFICYQNGGGTLSEQEFGEQLLSCNGISQINEYLEQMILNLQYPGMSEAEIEEELKKKIARLKRMSSIGIQ